MAYVDPDFKTKKALKEALADTFAEDNPKFEREKFYKACWEGKEQTGGD